MIARSSIISSFLVLSLIVLGGCGAETDDTQNVDQSQAAAVSAADEVPKTEHPNTQEWDNLFSADLANADLESPDSWVQESGVLKANDRSTVWTQASYGDFVLDFEARVPDGTNSGVFFRTADKSDILSALELQMYNPPGNDSEADERHVYGGRNGMASMYDLKGPSGGEPKAAGEWNRFTITAQDSMIYVIMNGEQVHRVNLSEWTEPGMTPDGKEHKFDRALEDQASSGPIGFQGIHSQNGLSVEYRNIKVKKLGS